MAKLTFRIHNDDDSDYVDISGDTVDEVRKKAQSRITLPGWTSGWSELIDGVIEEAPKKVVDK